MISPFLLVTIGCYLVVASFIGIRILQLRSKKMSVVVPGSVRQALDHKVDSFAFHLVVVSREAFHHSYLSVLVLGHKLALIAKYLTHKIERRFGKVINSVKGKQELSKQGDASHFLREIKDHQDKIRLGLID